MKARTNLLAMLITVLAFGGGMIYFVIAFSAQDAVWFVSGFDQVPIRPLVYHEGQKTEYTVGTSGYKELAEGVRLSLDSGVARLSGTGLSTESLQEAYTRYVTVEAFFDPPAKLHAWFFTGNSIQMFFPITGRHSDESTVFLSSTGTYMSGGPVLKDRQPLFVALDSLGYKTQ